MLSLPVAPERVTPVKISVTIVLKCVIAALTTVWYVPLMLSEVSVKYSLACVEAASLPPYKMLYVNASVQRPMFCSSKSSMSLSNPAGGVVSLLMCAIISVLINGLFACSLSLAATLFESTPLKSGNTSVLVMSAT